MTHPFCASIIEHLETISGRVLVCLDPIGDDRLWKDFSPNLTSPGNLILHLNGNLSQYILKTLGEKNFSRERAKEFSAKPGTDRKTLGKTFRATVDECIAVIRSLDEAQLARTYRVQGFVHTGYGILVHAVEHLSHHTGQFAWFTKYLFAADIDFYRGRDLDVD